MAAGLHHGGALRHLLHALAYCREHKGPRIHAWVILDNHFHAILAAPDLSRVLADLKRHTARRLVEQLENERCAWLLHQLAHFRRAQKAESKLKRGLVASPEHWRCRSCASMPGDEGRAVQLPGRARSQSLVDLLHLDPAPSAAVSGSFARAGAL